ncbi:cellular tumor antigen p53-like isoform X2 [Tachypleus tridentatus]|uniref:cellular tumor antigen p53-like isoform X2 n=2 Tax=Tachypleus tridentatus TaxID=6853 RepID=UPI003FCFC7A4
MTNRGTSHEMEEEQDPATMTASFSDLDLQLSQETMKQMWEELEKLSPNGSFTVVDQTTIGSGDPENEALVECDKFVIDQHIYAHQVNSMVSPNDINPSTSVATRTDFSNGIIHMDFPNISNLQPVITQQEQFQQTPASCALPATDNWLGQYGFSVSFGPQERPTKSTTWTYSELKDKLYVNMGSACPVRFHTYHPTQPGTILRAMAVFTKPEYVTEVVKRCLNHSSPGDTTNENHPAPEHLIRCDSPQSCYFIDVNTKRHSVTIPFENPQAGMSYTTYLFKFMCLGSCVGGLNRRPIKVIFTLENEHGLCMGRRSLEVRICACPVRDRRTEEKHLEQQREAHSQSVGEAVKRTTAKIRHELMTVAPAPKKLKPNGEDDEIFNIKVRGRRNYELLCTMRDALERQRYLTPEQIRAYQQEKITILNSQNSQPEAEEVTSSTTADHVTQTALAKHCLNTRNESLSLYHDTSIPIGQECLVSEGGVINYSKERLDEIIAPDSSTTIKSEKQQSSDNDKNLAKDETVASWLWSLGLVAYLDRFTERNLHTMKQLQQLTYEELKQLHIGEAHQEKIWQALSLWKQSISSAESSDRQKTDLDRCGSSTTSLSASQTATKTHKRYEVMRIRLVQNIAVKNEHNYFSGAPAD